MKLKVVASGSKAEERKIFRWGVSFLLGRDVLFDSFGREDIFSQNLKKFKINPHQIRDIAISHQHWDHTKGLFWLLKNYKNEKFRVYICPDFSQSFKRRLRRYNAEIIEAREKFRIKRNIYLTGEIDKFSIPEQALVVEKKKGLILITGCAHPGIVKMIDKAKNLFNKEVIYILGGFHLKDKTKKEIEEVILEIKNRKVKKVAPTHCTGEIAKNYFREVWRKNFIQLQEGLEIEI